MNTIPMQSVNSSQIMAVGYDASAETLAIQFWAKGKTPGSVYHYTPVPLGMYQGLVAAESVGKFFGQHIRGKDGIACRKIDTQREAA